MLVRNLLFFLSCLFLVGESQAKSWRGIVPLKSTRADVERLLGKPDSRGRYQFADERGSIRYRENPCIGAYQPLAEDNCECMVSMETVVSIFVTLEVTRTFSSLHLDKTKYQRRPFNAGPLFVDYINWDEGVIYTVDESSDDLIHIEYVPSATDCKEMIARNAPTFRNSWRGLIPVHSNRTDVERLLGPPASTSDGHHVYQTDSETVTVLYSKGGCKTGEDEWNVSLGVMVKMWVSPTITFETRYLHLDPLRFRREESPRFPETPGKLVNYTDEANGVIVRASDVGHGETIISITYSPSRKDENLRCKAGQGT
jgi:hypothetical protein